ncbi:cotranscriptional regulator FAM172A homolog isoform X1, partial [Tachysurus ichikawai]
MFLSRVDGQLRHTKTGEPFVFNYKERMHRWNQKRYEALGEVISTLTLFHTSS